MFGYKKFTTVIMDGSNDYVNGEVMGIMDMMTQRKI